MPLFSSSTPFDQDVGEYLEISWISLNHMIMTAVSYAASRRKFTSGTHGVERFRCLCRFAVKLEDLW